MQVIGADREVAGTVVDVWVDRSEMHRPLLRGRGLRRWRNAPRAAAGQFRLDRRASRARSTSARCIASQFAGVPGLKQADSITLLEEEKIMAYYGAGTLYATPARAEPLL